MNHSYWFRLFAMFIIFSQTALSMTTRSPSIKEHLERFCGYQKICCGYVQTAIHSVFMISRLKEIPNMQCKVRIKFTSRFRRQTCVIFHHGVFGTRLMKWPPQENDWLISSKVAINRCLYSLQTVLGFLNFLEGIISFCMCQYLARREKNNCWT